MKTQWNTGRLYSARGQLIVAMQRQDGTVIFNDHSRGIDGVLLNAKPQHDGEPEVFSTLSAAELEQAVMVHYDHGLYGWDKTNEARDNLPWQE